MVSMSKGVLILRQLKYMFSISLIYIEKLSYLKYFLRKCSFIINTRKDRLSNAESGVSNFNLSIFSFLILLSNDFGFFSLVLLMNLFCPQSSLVNSLVLFLLCARWMVRLSWFFRSSSVDVLLDGSAGDPDRYSSKSFISLSASIILCCLLMLVISTESL
jgi:hypothetical protein